MTGTFDTAFAAMVRSASAGDENQILELARALRSDYPLSGPERELLAGLVERLLPKGKGRPSRPRICPAWQRDAAVEYLERKREGEDSEAVANEIYNRLSVGRSTFYEWVSTVSETVERLNAMGLDGLNLLRDGNPSN